MANIIQLRFSGKAPTNSAKYLYTGIWPTNNCLEALATDFYNSAVSALNFTTTLHSNFSSMFDTDSATFTLANGLFTLGFPNYHIIPHAIRLEVGANSATTPTTGNAFSLNIRYPSNTTSTTTPSVLQSGVSLQGFNSGPVIFLYQNLQINPAYQGYLESISLGTPADNIRLYNVSIFGEVFHRNNNILSPIKTPTTIETFTDSFIPIDVLEEGVINKNTSLVLRQQRPFRTIALTLTATYSIPSTGEFNAFIINPNGANRIVNLPLNPLDHQYVRIVNTNGGFSLDVRDSNTITSVQILSNATSTNMLEAVWSGTQWIVTT